MAAYLTASEFETLSVMPAEFIAELPAGWLDANLEVWSDWINGRLRKRYAAPFAAPVPGIVKLWLARIVTFEAYKRRGWDPTDEQAQQISEDNATARDEIKEAANAVDGLFDLPLRQDTTASGISKGGPLSYSEASPYVAFDRQGDVARNEDSNGGGTFG